ncbi:MAG: VWA domain-containing protein [Kiritimatiellae bacterium]|nr:VWA domain-containing protein [Kiritimatiellia bacterium]
MTKERREDIVLIAVAVSLALHAVLVFCVKGRVMSTGIDEKYMPRQVRVTRIENTSTPKDIVKIEDILDQDAKRTAPEATIADELAPELRRVEDSTSLPIAVPPEATMPKAPEPKFQDFEVVAVKDINSPRIEKPLKMPAHVPTARILAMAPSVVPTPNKDTSFYMPKLSQTPKLSSVPRVKKSEVSSFAKEDSTPQFKPVDTVLDKVDKVVIEAEKKAVRQLLDAPNVEELSQFVDVKTTSAQDGNWKYFHITVNPLDVLKVVPKDFVLLIDASGSIGRERMVSLRAAAKGILSTAMNTADRFNLVAFRNHYSYAFKNWRQCTQSSFDEAYEWINDLASYGRTDVFATIESVLTLPRDPARPLIALVVTDGDANSGFSSTAGIIQKFSKLNDGLVSVYMYGVKKEANIELIDVLTRGNRGESFVYTGSRRTAGKGLQGLTERFRDPVLTDIRLIFASSCKAEVYPRMVKNIYVGSPTEIYGRVPMDVNELEFSLRGLNGKASYESFFKIPFSSTKFDPRARSLFDEQKTLDDKIKGI